MAKTKQKLLIIDANALIHRAFHALPPLTAKDGTLTNAVYGFTAILLKALKDIRPDYLVACFDLKAKTFRHEQYEDYKATRVKAPDELYEQIPLVKQVLEAFGIAVFEKSGFEADDLIGTISHLKSVDRPDIETIIMTGDQDTLQLVDDNTKVLSPHKGFNETVLYGEKEVIEKFGGLTPSQLIDYKALAGDTSDNIPGVRGIGPKGAITLLSAFGSLEKIYQHLDSSKISARTRELLTQYQADAMMSQKLATIILDAPIDFQLAACRFAGFDKQAVIDIFQRLNFKRLLSQLANLDDGQLVIKGGQSGLFEHQDTATTTPDSPAVQKKIGPQDYQLIQTVDELDELIKNLKQQTEFCWDTETSGLDPFRAQLLGISFCWQNGLAYYLPWQLGKKRLIEIKQLFFDAQIKKIGHNIKFDWEALATAGLQVAGVYFDTMVASYLLNPGNRQHSLDTLAFVELGYQMQSIEELIGKGKSQITLAEVPIEKVSWYSCEDADITWRLYQHLKKELSDQGMFGLFEELEMPLVSVLARVEANGVKIDVDQLKDQAKKLGARLKKIEQKIFTLAGEKFNPASPLQLKEILFNKLKIDTAGLAKTKTGVSTGAAELEKLSAWLKESPGNKKKIALIDLILEFRELSKLKNTYLDALPELVNPHDGRVHTSFNQTVTATGRLSSSEPNLQNIPIRTETGQQIRRAFIAEPGYQILKADYSQIELRIVASLANDKKMLAAFDDKIDIHSQTAAAINNVPLPEVTPTLRRQAKEVNFGVLYGMGAWGLASRTDLSHAEAQQFINRYFNVYKEVKKYLDETIELARERGYVETFYGRRRYIPEINSGVQQVRSGAERMAVNMPVQGTAADLIKLAMVAIDQKLPGISPRAKMIMQVHDELVFEVPEKEVAKVAELVRETMNSVYKLRAPIATEVSVGDNWGETSPLSSRL